MKCQRTVPLCLSLVASLLMHVAGISFFDAGMPEFSQSSVAASSALQATFRYRDIAGGLAHSTELQTQKSEQENLPDTITKTNKQEERRESISAPIDSYFPISQLTQPPRPLHEVSTTPTEINVRNLAGSAEIMLLISSSGTIDFVLVVESTLPHELLEYAVAQFKTAKFSPGYVNSHAVRSRVRIELTPPQNDTTETGHPWSAKNRRKEAPLN